MSTPKKAGHFVWFKFASPEAMQTDRLKAAAAATERIRKAADRLQLSGKDVNEVFAVEPTQSQLKPE